MNQDLINLLLYLQRETKKNPVRDDSLVHVIKVGSESFSLSDAVVSINKKSHPVKWDEFQFKNEWFK